MINVLQEILNRSKTAQELIIHLRSEKKADVLILSEQYQDRSDPQTAADMDMYRLSAAASHM